MKMLVIAMQFSRDTTDSERPSRNRCRHDDKCVSGQVHGRVKDANDVTDHEGTETVLPQNEIEDKSVEIWLTS